MSLIPEEIIAQVVDRCDIVETIASYVPLKRAGRNFKGLCPFHNEKTSSFVVNPDKQIFHCFGCGVGGNVISFIMKQERLEFPEALRLLAQKVNVVIPANDLPVRKDDNIRNAIFKVNEIAADYFHKILLYDKNPQAQKARDYLKKRDLTVETAQQFKIGFAFDDWEGLLVHLKALDVHPVLMEKAGLVIPRDNRDGHYDRFRNRVIFPIFDTRGQCRAFGARAFNEESGAKYINSPETPVYTKGHHLYGFHLAKQAIAERDTVVIVEGYLDCITPHQAGVKNVVASLGTALTVEQVRLLRRYTKNVVMLFDADQAGESAMLRSLDLLIEEGLHVHVAALSQGDDPDSYIRKNGAESFVQRLEQAATLFDYKLNVLKDQHDSRTVEGKSKIVEAMVPTINKFDDAVMFTGYIKRLAESLGIPQSAVLIQSEKAGRKDLKLPQKLNVPITDNLALRPVETNILKLLLHEESLIPITKQEVEINDFQDHKIRSVISKIYDLFEKGKKVSLGNLIHSFEDQHTQQMLTRLMTDEEPVLGDKQKMYRDYINRMKNDRLKLQRQELVEKIRAAEQSGDTDKLYSLREKFNQLVKN